MNIFIMGFRDDACVENASTMRYCTVTFGTQFALEGSALQGVIGSGARSWSGMKSSRYSVHLDYFGMTGRSPVGALSGPEAWADSMIDASRRQTSWMSQMSQSFQIHVHDLCNARGA